MFFCEVPGTLLCFYWSVEGGKKSC